MEVVPKLVRRLNGKQDIRTAEQKKQAIIEKVYYDKDTGYRNLRRSGRPLKF